MPTFVVNAHERAIDEMLDGLGVPTLCGLPYEKHFKALSLFFKSLREMTSDERAKSELYRLQNRTSYLIGVFLAGWKCRLEMRYCLEDAKEANMDPKEAVNLLRETFSTNVAYFTDCFGPNTAHLEVLQPTMCAVESLIKRIQELEDQVASLTKTTPEVLSAWSPGSEPAVAYASAGEEDDAHDAPTDEDIMDVTPISASEEGDVHRDAAVEQDTGHEGSSSGASDEPRSYEKLDPILHIIRDRREPTIDFEFHEKHETMSLRDEMRICDWEKAFITARKGTAQTELQCFRRMVMGLKALAAYDRAGAEGAWWEKEGKRWPIKTSRSSSEQQIFNTRAQELAKSSKCKGKEAWENFRRWTNPAMLLVQRIGGVALLALAKDSAFTVNLKKGTSHCPVFDATIEGELKKWLSQYDCAWLKDRELRENMDRFVEMALWEASKWEDPESQAQLEAVMSRLESATPAGRKRKRTDTDD